MTVLEKISGAATNIEGSLQENSDHARGIILFTFVS